VYNQLEQGDILSYICVRLATIAYLDILLCSIWAMHKIRQTPISNCCARSLVLTQPAVPSAVSYEDVQEGNDLYRAFGQCTHGQSTGIRPARQRCICQHYDGDRARIGDMANPGERLLNIVK
jgi:hypothetical protein